MRYKFKLVMITMLVTITLSGLAIAKVDEHGNLVLENNYISIFVNQGQFNQGRFALDVTGGAPLRDGDDGKPLIYGRPAPWTSYTTIRIDGTNYIFGGKTNKRAGLKGKYGQVITPPQIKNNQIVTKYKYGKIVVTQILSFVKSNTTGLPDTARIKYRITNQGKKAHQIGLRVMLDTMLGKNDGAPFRIKNQAVTSDKLYTKDELASFWQAFDSLNNPQVTAQGTIQGPTLTTPDRIYFTDWGSLADGVWNFDFNPGQKFLRKGEFELDSALALFWQPKALQPGETREYITDYGLGGITIVPGLLSLGVTSPAKVIMNKPDKSLQIIAYIQNTAEIEVKDVKVKLDLPAGLELLSTSQIKSLGDLNPQETAQIMWKVRPKELKTQNLDYTVKVTADNTDDNQVSRSLKVVGPPKLNLELKTAKKIKVKNNHLQQDSITIYGTISNSGDSTAYGVNAYVALPPGLTISAGDRAEKYIGSLAPHSSIKIPWTIEPVGLIKGDLPYFIGVDSTNAANQIQSTKLTVQKRQPTVGFKIKEETKITVGDYITVQIKVDNIANLYRINSSIGYNPQVLEPIYISRGSLFVDNNNLLSWSTPQIKRDIGVIKEINGALDTPQDIKEDIVASIHFKVKSAGDSNLRFIKYNAYNDSKELISVKLQEKELDIGGDQDEPKIN